MKKLYLSLLLVVSLSYVVRSQDQISPEQIEEYKQELIREIDANSKMA